MPEMNETIAKALEPKPKNLLKCDWTTCKKTHEKSINYPDGGTVSRNSSYAASWAAAGLEPWDLYGAGKDSKATLTDYRSETPAAAYAVTAAALTHPKYHTQKHHLISVNLFKNVAKLSSNAKLIGYDVNHKNNGSCFPSYVVDIVRHDLQCHRGGHPRNTYNSKIAPLLRELEKQCVKYCEMDLDCSTDSQKELMEDLNQLSERCYRQIKSWKWLLRSKAMAERETSHKRLKAKQG